MTTPAAATYSSNNIARLAKRLFPATANPDGRVGGDIMPQGARIGVIDRFRAIRDSLRDREANVIGIPILVLQ